MYSLLLMSALAGAPDASGFGWRSGGCTGATSCTGYTSCSGYTSCGGYNSCCGYSTCSGSGRVGFLGIVDCIRGNRVASSSCSGYSSCSGSCHGSSWGSCYGSSCWGSSCHGSMPAYSCSGGPGFMPPYTGCTGCTGCAGYIVPSAAVAVPTVSYEALPIIVAGHAPARLTIELPSDAKLFVDGQLIAGSGPSRQFHTPELPVGQSFFYELKAELTVNGKTAVEETKVVVRAGDLSNAKFEKLIAAAAPRELPAK